MEGAKSFQRNRNLNYMVKRERVDLNYLYILRNE